MSSSELGIRTKLIAALVESDEMRRSERADRIQWLSEHQIPLGVVVGPMDTMAAIGEARDCFVEGHYIASLVLAVAVIEHIITDSLVERGLAHYGLAFADAIRGADHADVFPSELLRRADNLRQVRNPFSHRKSNSHQYSFGNRFLAERVHPRAILERDAKDALSLMYAFFHSTLQVG